MPGCYGCVTVPQMFSEIIDAAHKLIAAGAALTTLLSGATVNETAVRGESVQVATAPPPPPMPGLNGLPFAPESLGGCDEMKWYAEQAGLPSDFGWIGYEESRCDNNASTWCCHGYWQIHELHIGDRSRNDCGVTSKWDYDDLTAISKQKSACMAAIVLDRQGMCAWDVVRC